MLTANEKTSLLARIMELPCIAVRDNEVLITWKCQQAFSLDLFNEDPMLCMDWATSDLERNATEAVTEKRRLLAKIREEHCDVGKETLSRDRPK